MKRGEVTPLEHLERRRRRLVEEVEEEASRFSEHIQTEKTFKKAFVLLLTSKATRLIIHSMKILW